MAYRGRLGVAVVCGALWCGPAAAQPRLHSHAVVGVGQHSSSAKSDSTIEIAGGADGRVAGGHLGLKVEIGYLTPVDGLSRGRGVLAPAAVLYPSSASSFRPFVTAGYALLFRTTALHAVTVGAGVEYWSGQRMGLRVELRDHIHSPRGGFRSHFWAVRAGIVVR